MQLRATALFTTVLAVAGYRPALLPQQTATAVSSRTAPVTMINLFGNNGTHRALRLPALRRRGARGGCCPFARSVGRVRTP